MAHPLGFNLNAHIQRACRPPATEKSRIRTGDIVRQRSGGPLLCVTDVDGDDIYCDGFLDPFNADGLEIVTSH